MSSLFLIETPLHLINALEMVDYLHLDNYQFFIRYSGQYNNDLQINKLIDNYLSKEEKKHITSVLIVGDNKKISDYAKILFYKFYFKLWKRYYQYIIVGDFSSGFSSLLLKNFQRDKIILLDDGAKTISIQNQFTDNHFYNLFTMYDLYPKSGQKIFKNDFKILQHKLSKNLIYDEKTILFLGSKLYEEKIVSEQYYLKLIEQVALLYDTYQIIYIPHRGEEKEKLQKISLLDNINIKLCDYPIELYGLYETVIPKKVFSFYSTALWSMSKMYPGIQTIAFRFDYNQSKHKKAIDEIYHYYAHHMHIEDLSSFNFKADNE